MTAAIENRLKELQDEIEEARSQVLALRQAVQLRDDLLSVAAHELRNPMHELSLQLVLAETIAQRHGALELRERIGRARRSLSRFIDHATVLLDATSMRMEEVKLTASEIDIAELAHSLVEAKQEEAAFFRTSVEYQGPQRLIFKSDRIALERVLGNLMLNAFKHASSTRVTVRLASLANGAVELFVTDDGIGIAAQDQQRVFNKFEQLTRSEGLRSGLGLGLWIVRRLVEAMNGTIEIESAKNAGTSFVIRLPCSQNLI